MATTRKKAAAPNSILVEQIRERRRDHLLLLSVLYRDSGGAPLRPVAIGALREAAGLDESRFRRALLSLEGYRHAHVFDENDRLYARDRWDREGGGGSRDAWDDGSSGASRPFVVELAEQGHVTFEYMALHPDQETEIGTFEESFDPSIFS